MARILDLGRAELTIPGELTPEQIAAHNERRRLDHVAALRQQRVYDEARIARELKEAARLRVALEGDLSPLRRLELSQALGRAELAAETVTARLSAIDEQIKTYSKKGATV